MEGTLNPLDAHKFISEFYQSEGFGKQVANEKANSPLMRKLAKRAYEAGWRAHVDKGFTQMQKDIGETLTSFVKKDCAKKK